jgi:hypothetical protein
MGPLPNMWKGGLTGSAMTHRSDGMRDDSRFGKRSRMATRPGFARPES